MTRTFLDSSVLLRAWRGQDASPALAVMEDPQREFYTSQLVKLELLPKPTYEATPGEVEFYQIHFDQVKGEAHLSRELGAAALRLAGKFGLAAMDALHVAAALQADCAEFITDEKPGKPLYRVRGIKVRSVDSLS